MKEIRGRGELIVALGEVPASGLVRLFATAVIGVLAAVTLMIVPIANEPVAIMGGFVPAFAAVVVVADFLTAYLLWGQARAGRDPAVAVLSLTYSGSGFLIAASAWLFPAAFLVSPARMGNISGWLWIFGHMFFAGGVLFYALYPRTAAPDDPGFLRSRRRMRMVAVALLAGLYGLCESHILVPIVGRGVRFHPPIWLTASGLVMTVAAVACLAWCRRGRTVLDAWLLVAVSAALFEEGLVRLGDSRFCVSWYMARLISLTGALSVLGACLFEINRLYGGLVRNREQMTGVNAHLRAANSELAVRAERDDLTGLLNRRAILDRLAQALLDYRREGSGFSVLMVDLDHFKAINDQLGHLGGDHVLAQVAVRLKDAVRSSDAVGRYGGEEFLVFLQGARVAQARIVANKILQAIRAEPFFYQGRAVPVTVSIGVATIHAVDRTLEELVGRADKALYQAKRQGRDRQAVAERPNEDPNEDP